MPTGRGWGAGQLPKWAASEPTSAAQRRCDVLCRGAQRRGSPISQAGRPALRWGQCRETRSGGPAEASGALPWGAGSRGGLQRPRPDQIASLRLSGATAWAQAPGPPSRIVAGPLTVTAPGPEEVAPPRGAYRGLHLRGPCCCRIPGLGERDGQRPGPSRVPRSLLLVYPLPLPPGTARARENPNIPGLPGQPSAAQPWVLGSSVTQ